MGMEETQQIKSTVRAARKACSRIGGATLLRLVIGYAIVYGGCLAIWACAGAPQLIVWHGHMPDVLATMKKLGAYSGRNVLFYPLLIFFSILVANILPYALSVKKLGLRVRDFFAKPAITGYSAVTFGTAALSVSCAVGIVMALARYLLERCGIQLSTPNLELPLRSPLGTAVMLITIIVVAPVTEEFIFRGVVLGALKKYGACFAVVASSLLWALLHGNVVQAVPAFCLGLIFGVAALRAKSIIPTIVIHMINNFLATFAMFAKETGNPYIVVAGSIFVVSFMLAAAAAGITLFCFHHRQFFTSDMKAPACEAAHAGPKALLTSWPVILVILIYSAYIVFSVVPAG